MTKKTVNSTVGGRLSFHRLPDAQADSPEFSHSRMIEQEFATSWLALIAEGIAIVSLGVSTGVLYHRFILQTSWRNDTLIGTGFLVAVAFCGLSRAAFANSRSRPHAAGGDKLWSDFAMWFAAFLCLGFSSFAFHADEELSRGAILSFFLAGFPAFILVRHVMRRVFAQGLHLVRFMRNDTIVIASHSIHVNRIARALERSGCIPPYRVVLDVSSDATYWQDAFRAGLQSVTRHALQARHGAIYIAMEGFTEDHLQTIARTLSILPRAIHIIPDGAAQYLLRKPIQLAGELCSIEMQCEPMGLFQRIVKRNIDVAVSSAAIVIVLPILMAIAIAIKVETRGPVFFRQNRLGFGGRAFSILKFRTMMALENGDSVVQAKKDDARITRVGKWLRRLSLDELPQLFNVLRGDMSLVGPRPHAVAHDRLYTTLLENYEIRQHVKPGITGWAQVNGYRGETSTLDLMRRRVEHDIFYTANASLRLDIEILIRTIPTVFWQKNAY